MQKRQVTSFLFMWESLQFFYVREESLYLNRLIPIALLTNSSLHLSEFQLVS